MSMKNGQLFIVATPIGHLDDMTVRAVDVLRQVDVIAAEDTRHSRTLLRHYAITTACVALHEHNEQRMTELLIGRLKAGESVAVISDAGTPLISDPGFHLVRRARQAGLVVVPVPGPSALISALSVSGLPSDRFVFEGFLPAKAGSRRQRLSDLVAETRTLIFYEAPHRIVVTLRDMAAAFGLERPAVVARELTKRYETVLSGSLVDLLAQVETDAQQQKGEFVVLVQGAAEPVETGQVQLELQPMLEMLLAELPLKQAVSLAVKLSGASRNRIYDLALKLK